MAEDIGEAEVQLEEQTIGADPCSDIIIGSDDENLEDVCPEVIIVEDSEECVVECSDEDDLPEQNEIANIAAEETVASVDTKTPAKTFARTKQVVDTVKTPQVILQTQPAVVLQTEGGEPILIYRAELEKEFKKCPECGIGCICDWREIPGEELTIAYKCPAGHCGHTVNLHKLKFLKGLINTGK